MGMTRQMDCSDEACEIMSTLAPWLATAAKVRAAMPHSHHPATLHSDHAQVLDGSDSFHGAAGILVASRTMRVPAQLGLKVFFTHRGMPRSTTGRMARGWSTLAPK